MFAHSVSIRLKPTQLDKLSKPKLFRCLENRKVSRTKLRSSLPTEWTLSRSARGIRRPQRTAECGSKTPMEFTRKQFSVGADAAGALALLNETSSFATTTKGMKRSNCGL